MERDQVVRQLRQFYAQRAQVRQMEAALETLTECEREIIDKIYMQPVPRATDKICEMFDIEVAAVYRRRNKSLKKLQNFLGEMR